MKGCLRSIGFRIDQNSDQNPIDTCLHTADAIAELNLVVAR